MRATIERRQAIIEILCERRNETIDNLAFEFKVNRRTIRRDIEILSITFPFYTTKGTGGGIHVVEGFKLGMKYLTKEQEEFLESILDNYIELERKILEEILNTFRMPKLKNERK